LTERHRSDGSTLDSFSDEVLVVCPSCSGRALARLVPLGETRKAGWFRADQEGRVSCARCGYNARRTAFVRWKNGPADSVFDLPVWLRTPCAGHTLWAYNARHLDALEAFVRAPLRERRPPAGGTWRNQAWVSRIPRWISSAGNRDAVLRAIGRLRARLEEA
jgi:hypothetical protein